MAQLCVGFLCSCYLGHFLFLLQDKTIGGSPITDGSKHDDFLENSNILMVRFLLGNRGCSQLYLGKFIWLYNSIFILDRMSFLNGLLDHVQNCSRAKEEREIGLMIEYD